MRIMGIDPGTATTGFGVIDTEGSAFKFVSAGVITTPASDPMPARLKTIHEELTQLIKEFKPEVVVIELLYFATNVTTAFTVGQARGGGNSNGGASQVAHCRIHATSGQTGRNGLR